MGQRTPSYSPSPRGSYGRRSRSPSPRKHYGGRNRDPPTSLFVRNVSPDCRAEDLRRHFGRFGLMRDVYLPRDYYTGEPRGFGFVQYVVPENAVVAKDYMDRRIVHGREITVVFADENRKKPSQMRSMERIRGMMALSYDHYAQSRSRSPRSPGYYCSPRRATSSRSYSQYDRRNREDAYSRSRSPSYTPRDRRYREDSYSRSRSPSYSPRDRRYWEDTYSGSQSHSYSPRDRRYREDTYSRSCSRSYSYSPHDRRYRESSYSGSCSRNPRYDSPGESHSRLLGRSSSRRPSGHGCCSMSCSESSDRN